MIKQNKPIDRLSKPLERFLKLEAASGIMLIVFTLLAIIWANSPFKESYYGLIHTEFKISVGSFVFSHTLQHMVNDALMCIFFFIIGLELKREFAEGELKNPKSAALPIFAAIGGMIVPALLFLVINDSDSTKSGWGIVMATDIAFAVGLMAPSTPEHSKESFFEKMEHLKEKFFHAAKEDDHHAKTKALRGMSALSFSSMSMLDRLEIFFHPWNIFYVLPLFALFNAGFEPSRDSFFSSLSVAVSLSLFLGKPIGVILFSYLGVVLGIASLPRGAGFRDILGVGFLAGIGFTMSIFISMLAFNNELLVSEAKGGIFTASLLSGLVGYFILKGGRNARVDD
jgi:NhaA family Na+:H+ antiporter